MSLFLAFLSFIAFSDESAFIFFCFCSKMSFSFIFCLNCLICFRFIVSAYLCLLLFLCISWMVEDRTTFLTLVLPFFLLINLPAFFVLFFFEVFLVSLLVLLLLLMAFLMVNLKLYKFQHLYFCFMYQKLWFIQTATKQQKLNSNNLKLLLYQYITSFKNETSPWDVYCFVQTLKGPYDNHIWLKSRGLTNNSRLWDDIPVSSSCHAIMNHYWLCFVVVECVSEKRRHKRQSVRETKTRQSTIFW